MINFFRKPCGTFLRRTHTCRLTPFSALCDTRNTFAFSLKVRFFRFFRKFPIFSISQNFFKMLSKHAGNAFSGLSWSRSLRKKKIDKLFSSIFFGLRMPYAVTKSVVWLSKTLAILNNSIYASLRIGTERPCRSSRA